jgi:hypothetical protein
MKPKPVPPKLKLHYKIKLYLQKKVFPLLTKNVKVALLISLMGGIPGLINIWNWAHQSPTFVMHVEDIADGWAERDNQKFRFYMVAGAIYNGGTEPLFPQYFDLKIVLEDTILNIRSLSMKDTALIAKNTYDGSKTNLGNVSRNDLTKLIKVSPMDANFGIIFFPFPYIQGHNFSGFKSVKILCTDILGITRTYTLDIRLIDKNIHYYFSPKTGVNYPN